MTLTIGKQQSERQNVCNIEPGALVDLPAALHEYLAAPGRLFDDTPTPQNVGRLDLTFAPGSGQTRLISRSHSGPIYILHPIYTDTLYPEQVFIYTIQLGDGMVEGDRYLLNFTCEPGSAVHITSQSATKIFRMKEDLAYQSVNLTLKDEAFVEYLPDPVIPFRDSRYYQRLDLTIAPTATLIFGEILLPGRVACGERHQYTFYHSDVQAVRPDGTLLFADRVHLASLHAPPQSPGRLGAYETAGSLYLLTSRVAARELVDRLRCCLASQTEVLAGVSELPNGCGVCIRLLGCTSMAIKSAFHFAWNDARLAILGLPAPDLRKC